MTNINDTVNAVARNAGVEGHPAVRELIRVLEHRENSIRTGLRRYATGRGLTNAQVENLFIEVGLAERPAPVVQSGRIESALDEIKRQVSELHTRLNNL